MFLIDTNIVIYYLNGVKKADEFLTSHLGHLAISTITVSEVLSQSLLDEEALQNHIDFLKSNFIWLDIRREIIFKSASIRRQKKMKLPDAIIGATAIYHQCSLVSRNERDFNHLPINIIINPID